MPIYEYRCRACGHQFEDLRSTGESDETLDCQKCAAPKAERLLSLFSTTGLGKDGAGPSGGSCGTSGCPHQ